MVAVRLGGPIPLDYRHEVWSSAPLQLVPLAAQAVWIPRGGGSVANVAVRAATNGSWIGILVEWEDATKNLFAHRTTDFSDAVAVQIAASTGTAPYACMGQANSQVQIWQWRANRDVFAGADPTQAAAYPYALANLYPFADDPTFYPGWATGNFLSAYNTTPVETLVAGGPGTLTTASVHAVYGRGYHDGARWHVLFLRPLPSTAPDELALSERGSYSVAFAAWDGEREERDGIKSTSNWITLSLTPEPGPWWPSWLPPFVAVFLVTFFAVSGLLAIFFAWRKRRSREAGQDRGGTA